MNWKWLAKAGTVFDALFLLYVPLYLVAATIEGWTAWRIVMGSLLILVMAAYLNPRSRTRREIAAGDPKPWQFLRWMDISGPSGHENGHHEELYLRRLYVLRTPWFGIMLHWIKREDWDRDALHDHPWRFRRFILSGGYTEEVAFAAPYGKHENNYEPDELLPSKLLTHGLFSTSRFPDGAFHRITSVKPRTVSLVINGPKSNSWGFFVPGVGKVPWRDYVNGAR